MHYKTLKELNKITSMDCWACAYIMNDNPLLKVSRNVEPCKVLFKQTDSYRYRGKFSFRKYNSKGILSKESFGIYPTQSHCDKRVEFFDNEEECIAAYESYCRLAIDTMRTALQREIDNVESRIMKVMERNKK